METAPGPRCGSGAIAVAGSTATEGLTAWDAPGSRVGGSADEAADLDGAGRDRRAEGRDLILGRLRDQGVVLVEGCEQHALVRERADVVLPADAAAGARL